MFHYVRFHADGGACCSDGLRRFGRREVADAFAEAMRNEPGHSCGADAVSVFSSEEFIEEEGFIRLEVHRYSRHAKEWLGQCLAHTTNEPRRFKRD